MRLTVPGGAGAPKIAPIVDEREVVDPWGLGLRMTILRIDHPDWIAWNRKNENDPGVRAWKRAATEVQLSHATKGFRPGKAEEMEDRQLSKAAAKLADMDGAETAEQINNRLKAGIADILWKTGSCEAMREDDGTPFDLTDPKKRLELLMFQRDNEGRPFKVPDRGLKDGEGNPTTDPYAFMYLGDALYHLILDEAKDQAAFARAYLEQQVVHPLGSTAGSSTESG